jgi:hypothetical protein
MPVLNVSGDLGHSKRVFKLARYLNREMKSRGICILIFQYHRSKVADIYISRKLEDIIVLPVFAKLSDKVTHPK